jgi:peptide/nickel transport system substrate-binding protein
MRLRTSRASTTAAAAATLCVATLLLSACGAGRTDSGAAGANSGTKPLVVGTTDKVTSLDPAGAYDNGSFALMNQSYQFLMNFAPGSKDLKPDAAQNCQFSQPTVYTCTMKIGLKFANGHPLTAKSAAFSLNRVLKINDPNGPASLLGNLDNAAATSDTVVNFTLKKAND